MDNVSISFSIAQANSEQEWMKIFPVINYSRV